MILVKKKVFLFGCSFFFGCFLIVLSVHASNRLRNIMVSFDPVKFIVNGKDVTPSGNVFFNGKVYVPTSFDYDGTTYIPLRFLTSTTDLPIHWDQGSRVITIGQGAQTGTVYLSDLPYKLASSSEGGWQVAVMNNNNADANGTPLIANWSEMNVQGQVYQKGIAVGSDESQGAFFVISFKLDGLYSRLQAVVGYDAAWNSPFDTPDRIAFIGDGRTLSSIILTPDSSPQQVDFSLSGVQTLLVRLAWGHTCCSKNTLIDIVNPVLTKLYQ